MYKILKPFIPKLFRRNNKYYNNSYYQHKNFSIYNNIENLCSLFDCSNREVLESKTPIFLNKNIEFGSNGKEIKKKMGNPSYKFDRTVNSLNFDIFMYRMYLGGYKTKQEVHLYEDTLFYFNYIFSYINASDKNVLKELLCKKYLTEYIDLNEKIIVDKYNNKLFIKENVDFTIHYLSGNVDILKEFTALKEVNKINRKKLVEQNQTELLTKL